MPIKTSIIPPQSSALFLYFTPPSSIYDLVSYAEPIVSIGNQTGEGWFLTGEMVELIHEGVNNIV